jgi:hypothetical protein
LTTTPLNYGIRNVPDLDDDNDGVLDNEDAFMFDVSETIDSDGDGVGNNADTDDDNDKYLDADEIAAGSDPLRNASLPLDTDGDFISNVTDTDDDNDGITDDADAYPLVAIGDYADSDKDGAPDECDADCLALGMTADIDDDNDGIADADDPFPLNPNTLPQAPVISSIETENNALLVRFSPNGDGGSSIIDYTLTCGIDTISVTSVQSPIRITELENNVSYACSVTARNVLGSSAASESESGVPIERIRSGLNIPLLKAVLDAQSATQELN